MASINIAGDTSGSISLTVPAVAGTNTITLPAATGTVVLTGTTPTLNGITFPATQVPSADANTLDDYEEGTFTATFRIGGTSNSTNSGQYTKVGNVVTYSINFYADPFTKSGTGDLTVTGMPFVAKTNGFYMGQIGYLNTYNALTNGAAYVELPNASSTLTFRGAATDNIIAITNTMISNGVLLIRISGTYLTN